MRRNSSALLHALMLIDLLKTGNQVTIFHFKWTEWTFNDLSTREATAQRKHPKWYKISFSGSQTTMSSASLCRAHIGRVTRASWHSIQKRTDSDLPTYTKKNSMKHKVVAGACLLGSISVWSIVHFNLGKHHFILRWNLLDHFEQFG